MSPVFLHYFPTQERRPEAAQTLIRAEIWGKRARSVPWDIEDASLDAFKTATREVFFPDPPADQPC